ncbi:hypothetical protein F7230_07385 [Corynebacterium sp. 320]|uniref:hypothetical protein n=1 Tax=Corynebacterium TaxID=1716 RepID=UPI00125CA831|nr:MULTISPECIES: hypothetical protein [Corynebacterium]KAB1502818.1 hypothetical protein F7230_07385 [Corynebacterium sp. 320]KAB1550441.1 hypothetical protein F7232_09125 [Corynebacterium sp. 319]KAB1554828.1 hypothetical protein F7233_00700 [Corynebacterium sp. 321]KAB3526481.1 hypothetical protein F8354_07385 [Corynebacterium sp. 250]KAB3539800.1 hypothetical protein F8390_00435 [Corynebacterium sp. 366]
MVLFPSPSPSPHRRPPLAPTARTPLRALSAAALAASLIVAAPTATVVPAQAMYDPHVQENAGVWANPNGRSTDPQQQVSVAIEDVQPRMVMAGDRSVEFILRVQNHRDTPVGNVSLRLQSLPAVQTAAGVRRALLSNSGEYPEVSAPSDVDGVDFLGPGEQKTIRVRVSREAAGSPGADTAGSTSGTSSAGSDTAGADRAPDVTFTLPQLKDEGPHPIMFALMGDTLQGTQDIVSVARTTVTVAAAPKEDQAPTPMTLVWPLSADTDVAPGGMGDAPERAPLVLRSENLAKELADGGRLRGLLDAYRSAGEGPQGRALRASSCIAVDPDLVDTVERMTHGYRVGEQDTLMKSQPRRLRDSWGEIFGTDAPNQVEGTGVEDAQAWLEDLRALVKDACVVVLPYAGTDSNLLAEGAPDLALRARELGVDVVRRVLGVEPVEAVNIPTNGYVTEEGMAAVAGQTAVVASNSITVTQEAQLPEPDDADVNPNDAASDDATDAGQAADADPEWARRLTTVEAPAGAGGAGAAGAGFTALPFSDDLAAVLRSTGSRPEVAGFSNPDLRYDPTKDSPAARMGDALAVLDREVASGNPVLAVPPHDWSVSQEDAGAFLDALTSMFAEHRITPAPLTDAVAVSAGASGAPAGPAPAPEHPARPELAKGTTSSPFEDPVTTAPEFLESLAHAKDEVMNLRNVMVNDERIALTREVYTRPLLLDLLRAASSARANNQDSWAHERKIAHERITTVTDTAQALRSTIALVPPGNVITRSSNGSPILIVARNGLPLPVPVNVGYHTDEGLNLQVPTQQVIPAEGSITLSLPTTEDSDSVRRTNLSLWLADPNGQPISEPVSLTVQKTRGLGVQGVLIVMGLLVALGVGAKVLWSRRTASRPRMRSMRKVKSGLQRN